MGGGKSQKAGVPHAQAPPCLGPGDGQRAILQPAPQAAAPQREAVFGPADAGHWVSTDHAVQADAAPNRFYQVGEGLAEEGGSLCKGQQQGTGQMPFSCNLLAEAAVRPARLCEAKASGMTNSFRSVLAGGQLPGTVLRRSGNSAMID